MEKQLIMNSLQEKKSPCGFYEEKEDDSWIAEEYDTYARQRREPGNMNFAKWEKGGQKLEQNKNPRSHVPCLLSVS